MCSLQPRACTLQPAARNPVLPPSRQSCYLAHFKARALLRAAGVDDAALRTLARRGGGLDGAARTRLQAAQAGRGGAGAGGAAAGGATARGPAATLTGALALALTLTLILALALT